jgi:hypothetical protein
MRWQRETFIFVSVLILLTNVSLGASIINVPDATLAGVIRSTLGLPADVSITDEDMLGLVNLHAGYPMGITSLEGLQYASNLSSIYIAGNSVEDASPIQGLQHLTSVYFIGFGLRDISFALTLPRLRTLQIDENFVETVPTFPANSGLQFFSAIANGIRDVGPLTNLTTLLGVNLDDNPLGEQAYAIDIPIIQANNPRLGWLIYDPLPEPATIAGFAFCFAICAFRLRRIARPVQRHTCERSPKNVSRSLLCIGLFMIIRPTSALALDTYWIDGNGSWNNPSNWYPSYHEPQMDDSVYINNGGTARYNATEQADHSILYLTINYGAVDHLSCQLTIGNSLSIATAEDAIGIYTLEYPVWYNIRSQLQSAYTYMGWGSG